MDFGQISHKTIAELNADAVALNEITKILNKRNNFLENSMTAQSIIDEA